MSSPREAPRRSRHTVAPHWSDAETQRLQGGTQLAEDPECDLVHDQHVRVERGQCGAQDLAAQRDEVVHRRPERAGPVGAIVLLEHGGQGQQICPRGKREAAGFHQARADQGLAGERAARQELGDAQVATQVPEPLGVAAVQRDA